MLGNPINLLVDALASDGATFVLGAGASAPQVPTIAQLPKAVKRYASLLTSFPAGRLPPSPLRDLVAPMIAEALAATTVEDWRPAGMTPASISVILEYLISQAHWQRLPQYAIFHLLPQSSSIVSFNWDGLARARCPQGTIHHPHGTLRPRPMTIGKLEQLLDDTQLYDDPSARSWLLPGLVMPGEEESPRLHAAREDVLRLWMSATVGVVVGYSFGLGSALRYDRVWLDTFVEAFRRNGRPVHVLSPDATHIRGEIAELLDRTVDVYAWPCSWHALSRALLASARMHDAARLSELRIHEAVLERLYHRFLESPLAAA